MGIYSLLITYYSLLLLPRAFRSVGSIHFWKKHNFDTPKTLLYGSSKKVDPPKVDAPGR